MPATAQRLAIFQESVIREMTRLANLHGSINLAQGFPDFDPPAELIEALEKSARGPFPAARAHPRRRRAAAAYRGG